MAKSKKTEIRERLHSNLTRVRDLASIHMDVKQANVRRQDLPHTEVLRAAVVLLHATLEDFLRSLLAWQLPMTDNAQAFKGMKFRLDDETKPLDGLSVSQMLAHKGRKVDELIQDAITFHLEQSSFNNVRQVQLAMHALGVNFSEFNHEINALAAAMSRRHRIVHYADLNEKRGRGQSRHNSLSPRMVKVWVTNVEKFSESLLAQFDSRGNLLKQ